jgi:hypothetical protein
MTEKEYLNFEVPPGLKERITKYLEKPHREYNTQAQLVIGAIQRELDRLGA